MKVYRGLRRDHRTHVNVVDPDHQDGGYPLNPRYDLRNHSPTGLEWGYAGSGPAQLALGLLADATGDDELALNMYQAFKAAIVLFLPSPSWEMTADQVRAWVETGRLDGHRLW